MSTNDDERQARLAAIRRMHVPETDSDVQDVDFGPIIEIGPYCAECGDEWPCEQGLLLAELEAATARAERYRSALLRVSQLLDEWGGAALAPARRWGVIEARKMAAAALAEGA